MNIWVKIPRKKSYPIPVIDSQTLKNCCSGLVQDEEEQNLVAYFSSASQQKEVKSHL